MKNLAFYKKLSPIILLACAASNADADMQTAGAVSMNNSVPTNDVFLNVWDQAASTSYSVDLGVALNTFEGEAGSTSITWDLDSAFTTFASTGHVLTYNIAAVDQNGGVYTNTTSDALMLSYPNGLESQSFSATIAYPKFNSDQSVVIGFINLLSSTGQETQTSSSAGYFNSTSWGIGEAVGSQLSDTTSGANKLSVLFLNTPNLPTIRTTTNMTETSPNGYFTLNTANSTLVWTASPVPLPGAVWLFLGGMMTVWSAQKRKSALKA